MKKAVEPFVEAKPTLAEDTPHPVLGVSQPKDADEEAAEPFAEANPTPAEGTPQLVPLAPQPKDGNKEAAELHDQMRKAWEEASDAE